MGSEGGQRLVSFKVVHFVCLRFLRPSWGRNSRAGKSSLLISLGAEVDDWGASRLGGGGFGCVWGGFMALCVTFVDVEDSVFGFSCSAIFVFDFLSVEE